MGLLTEGRHTADYISSEANGTRSREVVTLLAGNNLAPGAVLGRVTASGKYTAVDPVADDGSQNASAVLYDDVDASAADAAAVVTARDTEVVGSALTWKTGSTDEQIAEGVAQLATHGIVAR